MREQVKKRRTFYDFLNSETKPKFFLSTLYKGKNHRNFFLKKKDLFKEKWEWRIEQKMNRMLFLTALAAAIKKDPTTSTIKHANELKVHKKIV